MIKHGGLLSTLFCACTCLICTWRQNELSEPSDSDWLSYAWIVPAVSWYAFGFHFLWYACFCWPFIKHKLVKWPIYDSSCIGTFHRASKTFQVGRISTFATSIFLLECTSGVKWLLVVACLPFICIFVLCWLGFGLEVPLLVFAMWQLSALVSHEVNLGSLHLPCNLLDMSCSGLWGLIFLCMLAHLACWKLVQIYTAFINGLGHKIFIMQVKPEDVPMHDFGSLRWIFCQIDLGLYTVVPFIHTFGPLADLLASQIWHIPHCTEACRTS